MRPKYTVMRCLPVYASVMTSETQDISAQRKVYTVSRLNQEVQRLLESGFGTLWLQGELSNFSRPGSGHFYFTLKDSQSQIRCAMFKGRNRYVDFEPQSGDAVLVRGKLGLYAARGDFQLIVEHMEPAGEGRLQAAFEATKRKLDADGWFDVNTKQQLPKLPKTIGVVTSPTSAALRDVLQVLARRYRQSTVIIYPTLTQGAAAAPGIVKAIVKANRRNETDVLLLVRGGGSLEDLWAFNEIEVASAIRASDIPIVAGIGHEVDITISDLVADLRAPTPSAAAELATPDTSSLSQRVNDLARQLGKTQYAMVSALQQRLQQQNTRLQLRHPERQLREQSQRVDELHSRVLRAWLSRLRQHQHRVQGLATRLEANSPVVQLQQQLAAWRSLHQRMTAAVTLQQERAKAHFELLLRALHGVSPLAVLDRGYALVRKDGELLRDTASIIPGDKISARLTNGEVDATVTAIRPTGEILPVNHKSYDKNS